jgi:hypothetical protein
MSRIWQRINKLILIAQEALAPFCPDFNKKKVDALIHRKGKAISFEQLFLFAFDPTIPEYYQKLGWQKIGLDQFKEHPVTVMEIGL